MTAQAVAAWMNDTVVIDIEPSTSLRAPIHGPWDMQVEEGHGSRLKHTIVGGLLGGFAAAGAVVLYAFTCSNKGHDGPSCGIAIIFTPAVAAGGAVAGGAIGALLPAAHWRSLWD